MKRVVAIGGMPGTGKTTLMRKFMSQFSPLKQFRKLVNGHEYENYIILGDYSDSEKTFSGSDTWSMAVQPEAEQFFVENKKNVVFEGDRIFNKKMLSFIKSEGYDLLVIILEADDKTLKDRYLKRGSDQSEKFISGRKTKCDNIKNENDFVVCTISHETEENTETVINAINLFLEKGEIDSNLVKVERNSLDDFFS